MTTLLLVVAALLIVGGVVLALIRKRPALPTLPDDETESAGGPRLRKPHSVPPRRPASDGPPAPLPREKAGRAPEPAGAPEASREEPRPAPAVSAKPSPQAQAAPRKAERVEAEEGEREEEDIPESTVPLSVEVSAPPMPPPAAHKRDVAGLRQGLAKMRGAGGFFGRLKELIAGKTEIDPRLVDQIEEVLLTSDVGVKTTAMLLDDVRQALGRKELTSSERVWTRLRERARELLEIPGGGALRQRDKPTVVLFIGVNGTGKTTTIGKLATKLTEQGRKVLLVAGDTFRAAAVQQLQAWGKRVGCEVHAGADGADPASVVFDAITKAVKDKPEFVLVDTAGRLHTKSNLMDELRKVERTIKKALPGAPHDTILVVDGTTGQNAVQQVSEFGEALRLTGLVLTKLDGTAKGGSVLAIASEHRVPVRYVGVGERPQDLREFDADEFVEALLGQGDDPARAA